jgi:hypothetical protein
MVKACEPIHREHLEWARELAKPSDQRHLPNLFDGETTADRDAWLKAREDYHAEYDKTMKSSEANDLK